MSGIPLGIAGALVAGLALGLLNGFLIAYAGVNPFVATLGTATVVRGLIYVSTNATPFFGVPMSFTVVGLGRTGPLPNATWIFLAVASSWRSFCTKRDSGTTSTPSAATSSPRPRWGSMCAG